MRRYWVDDKVTIGTPYAIAGELFKHIHTVCRQTLGDKFELLVPKSKDQETGFLYLVQVIDIHKSVMVVDVLSRREVLALPRPHLHLVLSIPKIKTLEDIIEKIVELGVYSLTLVHSDFSFLKSKDKIQEKSKRLRKIVLSACQQSARSEELIINDPISLKDVLQQFSKLKATQKSNRGYAFYEGQAQSLSTYLQNEIKVSTDDNISDIWIFIGSEGGFSEPEVEAFKACGIPSLSLGEQVLRVETACVSIISVLKYYYRLF